MNAWIVAMWLSMPVLVVALYYLVEGLFWFFCLGFCAVDNHMQQRHWQRAMKKDPCNEPA